MKDKKQSKPDDQPATAAALDSASSDFLGFFVDRQMYAMPFSQVERVLRMVAVTPVPEEPPWVIGAINMRGTVLPVVSLRLRLHRAPKSICLDDRVIVVRAYSGLKAMIVDQVSGIINVPTQEVGPSPIPLPESPFLNCVITKGDDVIPVLDATKLVDTQLVVDDHEDKVATA